MSLAIYLHDHRAGAVVAEEMLQRLHANQPPAKSAFLTELRAEIAEDRILLEEIIRRVDAAPSQMRKAAGWLAEKAVALKLVWDDPQAGPFTLFESLEALSLGIEGKRCLWKTLQLLSPKLPSLEGLDWTSLEARAAAQRDKVEKWRLEVAQAALLGSNAASTSL